MKISSCKILSTLVMSLMATSLITAVTQNQAQAVSASPTETENVFKHNDITTLCLRPEDRKSLGLLLNQLSKRNRSFFERSKISFSVSHDKAKGDWNLVLEYWKKDKPAVIKNHEDSMPLLGVGKNINGKFEGKRKKLKEELKQLLDDLILYINTIKTIVSHMKLTKKQQDEIRSMIDSSDLDLPFGFVEEVLLNDNYVLDL